MTEPTDKHQQEAREEFNAYILEVRARIEKLAAGYSTYSGKRGAIRDVLAIIDSFIPGTSLSSRDQEIGEVLEGLRNEDGDCWCVHFGSDYHAEECEQAQRLYNRLQPVKEGENGDQL